MSHSIESIASTRQKTKETVRVESLLPLELRTKSAALIELLQDYYTFTNKANNPSYELNSISNSRDIDFATDKYLDMIQKEIAITLPKNLVTDRVRLYKALMKYYAVRGSQESIELFFKILFNDQVEVYYPKKDMLVPSSGNWDSTNTSYFSVNAIDQTTVPAFQVQVVSGGGVYAVGNIVSKNTLSGAYSTVIAIDPVNPTILTLSGLPSESTNVFTKTDILNAETTLVLGSYATAETVTGLVSARTATVVSTTDNTVTVTPTNTGNFNTGERLTGATSLTERYIDAIVKVASVSLNNFIAAETVTGQKTGAVGIVQSFTNNILLVRYATLNTANNTPSSGFFNVGELISSGGASLAKSRVISINNKVTLTLASTTAYTIGDTVEGSFSGAIGILESKTSSTVTLTQVLGAFRQSENAIITKTTSANLYSLSAVSNVPVIDAYLTLGIFNISEIVTGQTSGAIGTILTSTNSTLTILVTSTVGFSAGEAIIGSISETKRILNSVVPQIQFTTSNYIVGETITGLTSGRIGKVTSVTGPIVKLRNVANQAFTVNELLSGGSSLVKRKITTVTAGSSNAIRNIYIDGQQEFKVALRSATGSFTVGENVTGGTSGIYATVVSKTPASGASTLLVLKNASGNFSSLETITGATSGVTAQIAQVYSNGIYLDNRGFLDNTIKIQDSYFYQQFSYVIRTGNNVDLWSDAFNRLVHPAGFIFFGEILLVLLGITGAVRGVLKSVSVDEAGRIIATVMPHSQPGLISAEDMPVEIIIEFAPLTTTIAEIHNSMLMNIPTGTTSSLQLKYYDSNPMSLYKDLNFSDASLLANYPWANYTIADVINTTNTFRGYTLGVNYT